MPRTNSAVVVAGQVLDGRLAVDAREEERARRLRGERPESHAQMARLLGIAVEDRDRAGSR